MNTQRTDAMIAKAAALAKNLIHNPKDESERTEGALPDPSRVGKAGYQNPPDDLDTQLQGGSVSNPTTGSVACSAEARKALDAHVERAMAVYEGVYKQARLAGYSKEVACSQADDAKRTVDKAYRDSLVRQIYKAKSQGGIQ